MIRLCLLLVSIVVGYVVQDSTHADGLSRPSAPQGVYVGGRDLLAAPGQRYTERSACWSTTGAAERSRLGGHKSRAEVPVVARCTVARMSLNQTMWHQWSTRREALEF